MFEYVEPDERKTFHRVQGRTHVKKYVITLYNFIFDRTMIRK